MSGMASSAFTMRPAVLPASASCRRRAWSARRSQCVRLGIGPPHAAQAEDAAAPSLRQVSDFPGTSRRRSQCRRLSVPHAAQTQDVAAPTLRKLSDLPEEPGLPFLGVALQAVDPENDWQHVFEKHGSDAVWLNMGPGGGWLVALRTVEDVTECSITKSQAMFPKWPSTIENLLLPLGRSPTNEEYQPVRAVLGQLLSKSVVMKLHVPLMVSQFTETIRKHAASGEEVLWWGASKRLTFSAATRAALGDVLSRQDMDELFPLSVEAGKGIFHPDFGLKEGVPFTGYWRAAQTKKKLLALLRTRITTLLQDRRLLEGSKSHLREMLTVLEAEGGSQRDVVDRLARETFGLIFGGTDTTAQTMCRTMQFLARHPQWLDALAEEQQRLIAEYGEEIDRKVVSRSAVALAVAQEALRLKPIGGLLYRLTTEDVTVAGMAVPAGTKLGLCNRKMTQQVGNGSAEFDPQQWLSDDRTECASIVAEKGFYVFGKGPRKCLGQNLAMMELVTYLAILGREVKGVEMSSEEVERDFMGLHPTGMPLTLIPRGPQ